MCTPTVPATAAEALAMLESALGFLAAQDVTDMPAQAVADRLRILERTDAIEAAVRARLLQVFDAQDGHLGVGAGGENRGVRLANTLFACRTGPLSAHLFACRTFCHPL